MTKKISTSALGKLHNRQTREVFSRLLEEGMIAKEGESWKLTAAGEKHGGEYRESKQYGKYIVWPEDLFSNKPAPPPTGPMLSSTKLGERFGLQPKRMNKLLSEIGWIHRGVKGWQTTDSGRKLGGYEKQHHKTGVPYVLWPANILENRVLVDNVNDTKGVTADTQESPPESVEAKQAAAFREKFEAKYRATDGHFVRSRGELAIDNWLYMSGLVHAYERKLPIEEDVYCDFYLPGGKVYIEYWGMEEDAKYAARKRVKLDLYAKYSYNLIELTDADIFSLDDVMPRKLLSFGISAD
ncbi:MAG: glycerol kinase [Lentisphaeria bacterium]|nr:glycerol kinase [Lentisphaeria bacterium]